MAETESNDAQKSNLFVRVAVTRKHHQDLRPETNNDISLLAVEVSESQTQDSDTVELTIHVKRKVNSKN